MVKDEKYQGVSFLLNIFIVFSLFFSFTWFIPPSCYAAGFQKFKASPDQVLVLYNDDYETDVDGSVPGQDSKEVAEYYVKMHTDPVTGKKPYILGLKCNHGKQHLNDWVIREKSNDNTNGVIFKGKGKGPGGNDWPLDSRFVEIVVKPKKGRKIDWRSVEMACESERTGVRIKASPEVSGIPRTRKGKTVYPEVQEGRGRCFRFDAKSVFSGTVRVFFRVNDTKGKVFRDLKLRYFDFEDFEFSILGKDDISDELHFQEDVAIPVKTFLENEKNRRPDGTLLKDYILYIVICHGLPFSCEGVFGVERGVTSRQSDHGDLGSLEQRLQTMYYPWGTRIRPPVMSMAMSGGPQAKKGVGGRRITSAMRYPLAGLRWNPYMHPETYSFLGSRKNPDFIDLKPLAEKRKELASGLFAYGVSRLDGQGPVEAKRQIDYAVYASKYLCPEIDASVRKKGETVIDLPGRLAKAEKENAWGSSEEGALGFRVLSSHERQGIPFLGRPLEDGFMNKPVPVAKDKGAEWTGYYPGGMNRKVSSGNGWNMGRGAIWEHVDHGVTISACGGPAYGGGPHITNTTFWDNRILLRYLFRGRDLGECFLFSTYYVNWSTSLIGDPLLHPDLSFTKTDKTPPKVESVKDISVKLVPAMDGYAGEIMVPVASRGTAPEVATLELYYRKKGEDKEQVSTWPIYSVRPRAILRDLEPDTEYLCRPVLRDPYGNVSDVSRDLGLFRFKTGNRSKDKLITRSGKKSKGEWKIHLLRRKYFSESATIEVEFSSSAGGTMPVIRAGGIEVGRLRGQSGTPFKLGGPSRGWGPENSLPRADHVVMVLRWRRFPLTRELLFRAKNGQEFTYAADVRTPWETMSLKGPIAVKETDNVTIHAVKIFNDAYPASETACAVQVPPIDFPSWHQASQ